MGLVVLRSGPPFFLPLHLFFFDKVYTFFLKFFFYDVRRSFCYALGNK
jgi:hypothetical protein